MSRNLYSKNMDEEVKNSLYPKVILSVSAAKRRSDYLLLLRWSGLSFVFSPVTFVLLSALHTKLIESSTFEYISMLVNDSEARSLYFKEILFAVYDTIPVPGALLSLLSLVLVVVFYTKTMSIIAKTFLTKQSIY